MEIRLKKDITLPEDIYILSKGFKSKGFKLFVVGGAVRDALLGQKPKDFDLATDAVPDVVENLAEELGFRTIATGKSFGVINVFTKTDEFEIATFRHESYSSDINKEAFENYLKFLSVDRYKEFLNYF